MKRRTSLSKKLAKKDTIQESVKKKMFYVGHPRVMQPTDAWAKPTLFEAINHAKRLLEDDTENEFFVVVKVVRIVRRQRMPVLVEKV